MRRILVLVLVLSCIGGIGISYIYWNSIKYRWNKWTLSEVEERKDIQKSKDLLAQNKPDEALEIIMRYADYINNTSEIGKEWLDLLIRASTATLNLPQLVSLYEFYPKVFDAHEKAALLVANVYVTMGRTRDYQQLRDAWKGKETRPETWFILDADKLLQQGKRKEAEEFLKSRTFPSKADTTRLIRLALLLAIDDPQKAWDYLTEAYNKDPGNPEILSYRAKFLESTGKTSLALLEYMAAIQTDQKNLYLRDQLAEFYLRQKQYPYALEIWKENLNVPSLDFIWLKALFWSRVVIPIQFNWKAAQIPSGKLKPLIEYLRSLPTDEFWNSSAFEKLERYQQYLSSQQATFWLRLLQYLKEGQENEAYHLLQFNPFVSVSWNPGLEQALKAILLYRKTGQLIAEEVAQTDEEKASRKQVLHEISIQKNEPFLFAQLDFFVKNPPSATNKIPQDLQELLKGPEIFAAALTVTGWEEAGLKLNKLAVIPETYPKWVSFDLTQALRHNRSNKEALEFATKQYPTEPLSMLTGEILIAEHKYDQAIERLKKLYKGNSEIGKRSAWLMSLIYIERGDYKEAEAIVHAQPLLEKEVLGQETLARIALLEGNKELADKIYYSLAATSPEARSYLARKAFEEKDWPKAKELTEELLKEYPTNALLQQNYKKILEEINKTPGQE
jgi:predicted Zn-dependent protease